MKDSEVIHELLEIEKKDNPFLNLLIKVKGWDKWREIYKKYKIELLEDSK